MTGYLLLFVYIKLELGLQANSNYFYLMSRLKQDTFLKVPLQFLHCTGLNCTVSIIQGTGNFSIYFFYLVQELF